MSDKKTIVNQVIKEVKQKKTGKGDYGKWTLYNIKFVQDEKKYSWFAKETDFIPAPGMNAIVVDYIEEQNGEYTNYTIKKLQFDDSDSIINSDTPNSQATTYSNERDLSFYASYAKDLLIAQMPFNEKLQKADHATLCDAVILRGKRMLELARNGKVKKPKPKPEPEPIEEDQGGQDLPF